MAKVKLSYWHPTPVFWRKIGDTVLSAGTLITGYNILADDKGWAIASLALTFLGKTITNFASGTRKQDN